MLSAEAEIKINKTISDLEQKADEVFNFPSSVILKYFVLS